MKKTKVIICLIIAVLILGISTFLLFKYGEKRKEEEKIKNATVIVELNDERTLKFGQSARVSDFIENINGKILDDFQIDSVKLGKQTVSFEYINDENIKIPYSYEIEVVDDEAPYVMLGNSYSVTTNFNGLLEDKILCADNHDDEPFCQVQGEYDTKTVGKYNLNFYAKDSSGNETNIPFVLNVTKPSTGNGSSVGNESYFKFDEAKEKFKNENTLIGIDVSSWQGDIDFERVREAEVEFAMVRVGSKWGFDKDFFLDSKFHQNMKGFNEVGIPVGAYFYSYARNEDEARREAEWLLENIKGYDVSLPIAFDFEDWNNYNKYKMSLYRLNRNAEVFIETVEKAGYKGMIYGSVGKFNKLLDIEGKNVWVAHYTSNADYSKSYQIWQFSASGRVPGINSAVDLDVMYK